MTWGTYLRVVYVDRNFYTRSDLSIFEGDPVEDSKNFPLYKVQYFKLEKVYENLKERQLGEGKLVGKKLKEMWDRKLKKMEERKLKEGCKKCSG